MRPLRALPLPVLTALLLAGCGGDEPLSRAEYVKQADAICKDFSARQDKLGEPKSVKDIERLADDTKPLVEEQLKKLRALEAPDAIKGDANDAYDLLEQQVPKIDELVTAAKANDVKKIQAIASEAGKLDQEANAKAQKIGLKVCGES
ncbi:MAG: hypothetical protein JWO90_889 [Solirubrobacterales bacterium]|jgi:hypothetical protein|nr:hypothetical protein [Solirubrobacterales bacterium]